MYRIIISCFIFTLFCFPTVAADWPTYRADAFRSGFTEQSLPQKVSLHWTYQSPHLPQPAWKAPDTRMNFDHAFQTVVSNGTVLFGSSADCKVYALDAITGKEQWSYITESPIRFAPLLWKNQAYVVSDDGYLYCFHTQNGKLVWTKRGGPNNRMILGNDRMISRFPVRGAPVIKDNILYFAAGIWPSEGIFLYALDPESGKVLWCNDTSGSIAMPQPHGGAFAKSGVSAQGYLVATDSQLFVPTGRAVPAAFNRANGEFQYFHLQANRASGGGFIAANNSFFFNSGILFECESGQPHLKTNQSQFVSMPDGVVQSAKNKVSVYRWVETERIDRKGKKIPFTDLQLQWSIETPHEVVSMIVADQTIICGGYHGLCAIDMRTREIVWNQEIDGIPYGLAVANNRLYVSTDQGTIYCFGAFHDKKPFTNQPSVEKIEEQTDSIYSKMASQIIQDTGITEGYCLDLACGDGSLAIELAKRTDLQIYAIDSDEKNVQKVRAKLDKAGLYGVRITAHHGEPANTDYPNYFADLIVSGRSVKEDASIVPEEEAFRLQRPAGGIAYFGKFDGIQKTVRDELDKTGVWTHQYANPANTICSEDRLIRGPLEMLWFRDVDFDMPQRHGRGPGPLFYKGNMIMEGIDAIRTVNAYNGRPLWKFSLPGILKEYDQDHLMGVSGTGSNMCVDGNSVFIHNQDQCYQLDLDSGEVIHTYDPPDPSQTWGFLAAQNNTLFGTTANTEHVVKWRYLQGKMATQFTESSFLFTINTRTGQPKWQYEANHSIRHNTIAIGKEMVFLIDRPIAEFDRLDFNREKRRGKKLEHPTGTLIALDIQTGEEIWRNDDNIYGTMLALSEENNALLMSYQSTRFQLDSEIGGRLAAFCASTGERLWDIEADYASRPLINGQTIYAQPSAWDLLTGAQKDFQFTRSYGCGILASAANLLVYRSATLGYRDLEHDTETQNYGGIRPGCWINAIPAGGLILMPDAASGCTCSYLIQASIALQTKKEED